MRSAVGDALAIGAATGMRSSAGMSILVRAWWPRWSVLSAAAMASEIVMDKLPQTPPRTARTPLISRLTVAGLAGWAIARQRGAKPVVPGVSAMAASAVSAVVGANVREIAEAAGWKPVSTAYAIFEDACATAVTAIVGQPDRSSRT